MATMRQRNGKQKPNDQGNFVVATYISKEDYDRLNKWCDKEDRSKSWVLRKLVLEFLDEQ